MRGKKIQLVSYKRAIQQIGIYERNLAQGKERPSKQVEEFRKAVAPYLNKNGTLSKRALRSNKAKLQFNRIISEFKRGSARTATARKNLKSKIIEGLNESDFVARNKGAYNVSGKELLDTFVALSRDDLMNKLGFTCGEVIKLTTTVEGVTSADIKKVAEYLVRDKESTTPSFLKGELEQDASYNTAMKMLEYLESHDIPTEDIEETLDRIGRRKTPWDNEEEEKDSEE